MGYMFKNVSPEQSRRMSRIRKRGNRSTELAFRLALARAGIRNWKMHYEELVGCPDFFFPLQKTAVFVDGCFWHGCKCVRAPRENVGYWSAKLARNVTRDRNVRLLLLSEGVRVVRFWEHQICEDVDACVSKLHRILYCTSFP